MTRNPHYSCTSAAIADPLRLHVKRRTEGCVCIVACKMRDTLHEERAFGRCRDELS